MTLHICGLLETLHLRQKFTHLVSIVEPRFASAIPSLGIPPERRLLLLCDDVSNDDPSYGGATQPPSRDMIQTALAFTAPLTAHDQLLVHCLHGISRSTALAYAILCQAHPAKPETDVLRLVLKNRPNAYPNSLIVTLADDLLNRQGRMVDALEAYLMDPDGFAKG